MQWPPREYEEATKTKCSSSTPDAQLAPEWAGLACLQCEPDGTAARHSCEKSIRCLSAEEHTHSSSQPWSVLIELKMRSRKMSSERPGAAGAGAWPLPALANAKRLRLPAKAAVA